MEIIKEKDGTYSLHSKKTNVFISITDLEEQIKDCKNSIIILQKALTRLKKAGSKKGIIETNLLIYEDYVTYLSMQAESLFIQKINMFSRKTKE